MKATFKIHTKPFPKERPRYYKGKMYTPAKTRNFEAIVAQKYKEQCKQFFEDTPIKLKIKFEFQVPKSYNNTKRSEALNGILRPTRNDLDNLIKSVSDGLNGVAFSDDRFISYIEAEKCFSEINCITVTIEDME